MKAQILTAAERACTVQKHNELTPEGQHRAELCLIVRVHQDEVLDIQNPADVLPHPTVHWYAREAALQHPCITFTFYQRVGPLVVEYRAWETSVRKQQGLRVCTLTLYMASMVEKFSRDLSSKRNVCSRAVMTSLTLWKHRTQVDSSAAVEHVK